jgi:hypothetical protein
MDAGSLRTWLLKQPRPSNLRIVADNGTSHKFVCPEGVRWTEVAASVMALRPDLIEAFSDDGNLLRAVRPDEEQDDDELEEEDDKRAEVIDVPAGADPESQRLIIFARLISDAYRHSADVAFDKLAALFDAVVNRSEAQEKTISALDRLMQKMLLEKVAQAGASSGGGDEEGGGLTIESLINGFMQGKMQAAANGAANGTTHKEPTK